MTDAAGNYVATITYDGAGNATGITWGTS